MKQIRKRTFLGLLAWLSVIAISCTKSNELVSGTSGSTKEGLTKVQSILPVKEGKIKQVAYMKVNDVRITEAAHYHLKLTNEEEKNFLAPNFIDVAIVFESAKLIRKNSPKLRGTGSDVEGEVALVFKEWEQAKSFSPSAAALDKSLMYNSSGKQSMSPNDLGVYSLTMNKELQEDVKALKKTGMKVLLDIMPDHENAGWLSFKNSKEAKAIALQINNAINDYEFDGIDIDEEYATYTKDSRYPGSMTRVLHELSEIWNSENNKHPGKKLMVTKATYSDASDFKARIKVKHNGEEHEVGLVNYLTDAWNMNYYSTAETELPRYIAYGMKKEQMGAGIDFTGPNKNQDGQDKAKSALKFGCGYMMYYSILKKDLDKYSKMSKLFYDRELVYEDKLKMK